MSSDLLLPLGLAAVFAGVVLALSTVGVLTSERRQVGRSMTSLQGSGTAPQDMLRELDQPFAERVLAPLSGLATRFGRRLTPTGYAASARRRLDLAGSPARWDPDRVLSAKGFGLVVGVLTGLVLSALLDAGVLVVVGSTAVLTLGGFFGVDLWLYQTAYDRKAQLRRQLPDSMDLLSISVEAGLGFDAALSQVARNTTGALAGEFTRTLQEIQIGAGRTDALRAMAERTDLPELRSFVGSMVQADVLGIPIARVLKTQSAQLRLKRSQAAEEAAQKVPVKILFPLIFCILPSLFIVVIGPSAINIYRNLNL